MAARVAQGELPGAVWLVARGDDVSVDSVGVTHVGGSAPMRRGTIFRIASMTKAVTAGAVMMLVEEGKLGARAARQPFDAFVRERFLSPLGMRDTDFLVPPGKLARLAGCGTFTGPGGEKVRMDRDGVESAYATPPVFPSGAAGLVSTIDDFLVFARMLLAGGVHAGRRLLAASSVAEMTTDHLTQAQKAASASAFFPGNFDTNGWGYRVGVTVAADRISPVPGRYGWFRGFGTSWINDPKRDLVGIVMTQSSDFLFSGAVDAFWRAVYAPLEGRIVEALFGGAAAGALDHLLGDVHTQRASRQGGAGGVARGLASPAADVEHTVGRADDDRLAQSLVVPAQLRVVVIDQPQPRAKSGRVALQDVGQLLRMTQRHAVARRDLVRDHAEALGDHSTEEIGRQEAILRAQDEPGRHVRQRVERPRRRHRGPRRMRALLAQRLRGQLARHVVVEADVRILVAGHAAIPRGLPLHRLSIAGPVPPVARSLARSRDHAGDEDERVDLEPDGDQRCGEPAERLSDDDQVPPIAHRSNHCVRVVVQPERLVVARQVRGDYVVPARPQLGLDPVPVPADVSSAVDQDEGAHGPSRHHRIARAPPMSILRRDPLARMEAGRAVAR